MGFSKKYHQYQIIEYTLNYQLNVIYPDISDERARGVIRQIQGKGFSSLSRNQTHIYEKYVEPELQDRFIECIKCFEIIDKEDTFKLNDEDHMCNNCWEYISNRE